MYRFAPRDIGRIIDDAVEIYRANWRPILLSAAVVVFPLALATTLAQVFYWRGAFGLFGAALQGATPEVVDRQAGLGAVYTFSLAVAPLYSLAKLYLDAALLSSLPSWLSGVEVTPKALLAAGKRRFVMLVLVVFAVYVMTQVGLLFLLVPGIIAAVVFSVAGVTVVVEDAGFDTALRRSIILTRNNRWRVILFFIALAAVTFVLESALNSVSVIRQFVAAIGSSPEAIFREPSTGWKVAEGLLAGASLALVIPLGQIAWFLFYLDLRCRKEGMDLLVRAQRLAEKKSPAPPVGPGADTPAVL